MGQYIKIDGTWKTISTVYKKISGQWVLQDTYDFDDNLYLERGVLAKSNGELVEKVVRLAKELGRPIATSDEAREILGLKPRK